MYCDIKNNNAVEAEIVVFISNVAQSLQAFWMELLASQSICLGQSEFKVPYPMSYSPP